MVLLWMSEPHFGQKLRFGGFKTGIARIASGSIPSCSPLATS